MSIVKRYSVVFGVVAFVLTSIQVYYSIYQCEKLEGEWARETSSILYNHLTIKNGMITLEHLKGISGNVEPIALGSGGMFGKPMEKYKNNQKSMPIRKGPFKKYVIEPYLVLNYSKVINFSYLLGHEYSSEFTDSTELIVINENLLKIEGPGFSMIYKRKVGDS